MKRLITLTLALLIALSSFTTVSFAADVDFSVGLIVKDLDQEIIPDETFEVLLYTDTNDINTYTYQIGIDFDEEYFEYVSATSLVDDSIKGIDVAGAGCGDFAFYIDGTTLLANEDSIYELAVIKFKTLKKVDKSLTISIDDTRTTFLDADANELNFDVEDLIITLPEAPVKVSPKNDYFYPGDTLKLKTATAGAKIYYSNNANNERDTLARGNVITLPNKSVGYYIVAVKYGIESEVTNIKLTFRNPSGLGGGGGGGTGGTYVPPVVNKPEPTPVTPQAPTTKPATSKYADIKGHWAENDINKLINKKIISGYEDGTVKPGNPVTRAEIAKIIVCALGEKEAAVNLEFNDNGTIADWAAGYIQAAVNLGILNGYEDGSFKPNQPVTRQELAKIAMVAFKFGESEKALSFNDNSQIPDWSAKFIAAAVENGIINGYEDGSFLPANNVTRAEACAIISRCLK